MLKDLYLNEGGQSTAGKLLDHVTSTHAAYGELLAAAGVKDPKQGTPYGFLNECVRNTNKNAEHHNHENGTSNLLVSSRHFASESSYFVVRMCCHVC